MNSVEQHWDNFSKRDDSASFSVIYNHHIDELYAYGVSMGFERESCKDAIQDVFVKLYMSRKSLTDVANITAYIFRSFKNRLIDMTRTQRGSDSLENMEDTFKLEVTVLDDIIDSETTAAVKGKVNRLLSHITANQREAVYLRYAVGLPHKQIAEIMNINEESARKLLYRAMKKLREKASEGDYQDKAMVILLIQMLTDLI